MPFRWYNLRVVLGSCGPMLIWLAVSLAIPVLVGVGYGEYRQGWGTILAFLVPMGLSLSLGVVFKKRFHHGPPNTLQAMLVCSVGWLGFSAIGAIPFMIGIHSTFLDGFFEAMSGFTTTGITMYVGLDDMPKSILFWRALTQWIGGLGILTMFLAVSATGTGMHQLFEAEGHKINVGRPVPGLANTIKVLLGIYTIFTVVIILALWAFGMSLFDSVCHSFAALATGGYSPHDASIEYYRVTGFPHYIWLEYITILGMVMGGCNFAVLHYRLLKGNWRALFDNIEARYWWAFIGGFTALILLERVLRTAPYPGFSLLDGSCWAKLEEDFRIALFQVVSIITTTGFATRDIATSYFGEAARQLFMMMMVIGGCVGSTGGGIKVLRTAILSRLVRREVYRLRVPSQAITTLVIDGEPVDADEIQRVGALFFAWMVLLFLGGSITEFLSSYQGYEAFSGMFSAMGNVGPCYIPTDAMGKLHPIIKMVYILAMLAGRLEILPVLLLFSRRAWRV
jgi:trk system potassium uptake protein